MGETSEPTAPVNHNQDPAARVAWGAEQIGEIIGRNARQAHHLLISGEIKCARKVGGRWCASIPALSAEFSL